MAITHRVYQYIYIILVFFVLVAFTSCSEEEEKVTPQRTEYLFQQTEHAVDIWDRGFRDSAINYVDSVYSAYDNPNVADQYDYYYFKSDRYFRSGEYELSKLYCDSAIKVIERTGNTKTLSTRYAQANYHMGDRVLLDGDYKNAYVYYYRAKTIAKNNGDSCTLAYYNYKTGLVLYNGERYRDAVRYFQRARNEFSYCGIDFAYYYRTQQVIDNIGLCYTRLGMADSALRYYELALSYIDNNKGDYAESKLHQSKMASAVVWGNMGSAYELKEDYEKAEEFYLKSINVNQQVGFDNGDAQLTRAKLGLMYLKQGKDAQAFKEALILKNRLDSVDRPSVRKRWNKLLWKYYDKNSNIRLAYQHLQDYEHLKDSLSAYNKISHPIDLDERVSTLEGQDEVASLKETNETREQYLIIALVGCALCIVIVVLIVRNWSRTRKHVLELKKMNSHVKEQREKLKEVLNDLERADEEKDRILKAVSHDMRSPINSSLALVDLLSSESDNLTEEQVEYMKLLKVSGENALNLTKDLLEVATLSNEKLEKDLTNITAQLRDRVKLLEFKAAEKKQTIQLHLPENHISANVNIEKLLRVVSNLTNNAMKFSPTGSAIHVLLESDATYFTIKVKDNGIGIPDSMKSKVFDLFSEAKRYGTSGEQPYGLGLSICKQIVEAHDGKIWFESEEGKGTTFFVQIPIH